MRKLIALTLCLCTLLSLGTGAFASTVTDETMGNSANTVLQYGVDVGYIVSIPESIQIDSTGIGTSSVSIRNALLPSGTKLDVSITGNSYEDNAWHLKDVNDANNKLGYTISNNSVAFEPGDVVLSVNSGEAWNSAKTCNMQLNIIDDISKAGVYHDTLTFDVQLNSATNSLTTGIYRLNNPLETEYPTLPEDIDAALVATAQSDTPSEDAQKIIQQTVEECGFKTNLSADGATITAISVFYEISDELYTMIGGISQIVAFCEVSAQVDGEIMHMYAPMALFDAYYTAGPDIYPALTLPQSEEARRLFDQQFTRIYDITECSMMAYQAYYQSNRLFVYETGMTWQSWLASEFAKPVGVNNFTIQDGLVYTPDGAQIYNIATYDTYFEPTPVNADDALIDGGFYTHMAVITINGVTYHTLQRDWTDFFSDNNMTFETINYETTVSDGTRTGKLLNADGTTVYAVGPEHGKAYIIEWDA